MRQAITAIGIFLLIAVAAAHHLVGLSVVRVTSASMEPTYHVGQLLVIHTVEGSSIQPGDVPVVRPDAQSPAVVHRVVEVSGDVASTRGDANPSVDGWSVPLHGGVPVVLAAAPGVTAAWTGSPIKLLLLVAAIGVIGAGLPTRSSTSTPARTPIRTTA